MQSLLYMLSAMVIGMAVTVQPPLNAVLARAIGNAYGAAMISIAIALISIVIFVLFAGGGNISRVALSNVPWWVYLSGLVGAVFVASGVVIAPVTGALVFFICVIAGQLFGSILADHFGAFGLEIRPITFWRFLGLVMVFSGAVLVTQG